METTNKNYLKEENKELISSNNERLDYKISLRKKKYNEILSKKRLFSVQSNQNSLFSLELSLSNLILPDEYKIVFTKNEELITTSIINIKSNDIVKVKYGLFLLKSFSKSPNNSLSDYLNIAFISDLLLTLEKWSSKNEKCIVFNILYILTNYTFSYENKNNPLSNFFLTARGYSIWEQCFNLQNYEIMSQLVWILNNVIFDDNKGGYNFMMSNFFKMKIFDFYNNQFILSHFNETNENNIFFMIIEKGMMLLSNLLLVSPKDMSSLEVNEINKTKKIIFSLILKYAESNSKKIYEVCIYSISKSIDNDVNLQVPQLIEILENSNIMDKILDKKFFNEEKISLYGNQIIGNYISIIDKLSDEFYEKIINFEMDLLFSTKSSIVRKDIFWVLSNVLHDFQKSFLIINNNKLFFNKVFKLFNEGENFEEIKQISYFLLCVTMQANIKFLFDLQENGIIDKVVEYAKNTYQKPEDLVTIFQLIEAFLDSGEFLKDNYNGNNVIKNKYEKLGVEDIVEKYTNTNNEQLGDVIDNIISKYYNEKIF